MLWTVYQIGCAPMGAVYIGLTSDPVTRWSAHRSRGPIAEWMRQHPEFDPQMYAIEIFQDRAEAAKLERSLIEGFSPILNSTSATGGRPRIGSEPMTNRASKPWLGERPPISERTWYRREAERRKREAGDE